MIKDTGVCQLINKSKEASLELTILMPCLNEAATVGACIDEAATFLKNRRISGEILISDNGSMDGSLEIVRRRGARVVVCHEKGYGNALRLGLEQAQGKYIIMGDCDQSYSFLEIEKMYHLLKSGSDMVIGNRFADGAPTADAMPFSHRLGVPILSWLARKRFRCDIKDFHCGLRGVCKSSLEYLDFQTTGMEFATEMIAKASMAGMKIAQTPVRLRPDGRGRKSNLRTVRDGFRHLWVIFAK